MSDQRTILGPLNYKVWCHGSGRDDLDHLFMRLNTIDGVKRVIRQEIRDSYMVEVELNEDYPISALLGRVKREVTFWAIRNKVQLSTEP